MEKSIKAEQPENVLQNDEHNEFSTMLDDVLSTLTDTICNPPSVSSTSSASSSPTFSSITQPNIPNFERVRIKIVEQPALKGLRFRYICEGRSAGSIPGVHSTPENKTFPTIEIEGYEGKVKVVVSCVTKEEPYRPHPHNLVGKEGCEHGVCLATINGPPMRAVFSNLGIQCIRKKDIKDALEERERKRIDPFKTGFAHKDQPSSIDLNVVRLCFQAFIPIPGVKKPFPIPPVVSDPIYDKKSINDLVICRLCSCAAKVAGGDKIILLCEKVPKDDIKVRFFEIRNNELYWEGFGEFQQTDVHKQAAITFKTPRYINPDVNHKVQVYIQLYRPSDGETSEALPFEYYPDPGMRLFPRIQRKLKRRQDMEIFQQILSLDSETTATKYSVPSLSDTGEYDDDNENDNDNDDTIMSDSSASKPLSSDTIEAHKRPKKSFDNDYDDMDIDKDLTDNLSYTERSNSDIEIEVPVPQITFPIIDDTTQTSTPIDEILDERELTNVDKITEWIKNNQFERTDSTVLENGANMSLTDGEFNEISTVLKSSKQTTDMMDDNFISTDLIEQDIDLDDKYSYELLTKRSLTLDRNHRFKENQQSMENKRDWTDSVECSNCSASAQVSVDIDENFDETATYTSLQIALTNPIDIPNDNSLFNAQQVADKDEKKSCESIENDLVVVTNLHAPQIKVNIAPTPETSPSPPIPLPPRSPSPIRDQVLPPLPPKLKPSKESGLNFNTSPCNTASSSRNGSITSRPPSQIIIMRTPDQSPTKRSATSTPSPKKKQGFFARLFSRKKSKPTVVGDESYSKETTPNQSREPSIGNFSMNDNNRSSIRSVKSLQSNCMELDPKSNAKSGKTVGRSASSVSGKRPAQRNADVIHIPLKDDSCENLLKQERSYSSSCTLKYDGGHLDRKTLSALELAKIPISDGNMELIAIADRQSIKNLCEGAYGVILDPSVDLSEAEHFALYTSMPPQNITDNEENIFSNQNILTPEEVAMRLAAANDNIKRKRIRTGGNPMNILREIQQLEQNQMQCNMSNSTIDNTSMWNIQPALQSPSINPLMPEVKAEPFLSPNFCNNTYRNNYQGSPSPQPTSPMMIRNMTTPSPGLMRNSSAESQTQMSNMYNQSMMNLENNFNISANINNNQTHTNCDNIFNGNDIFYGGSTNNINKLTSNNNTNMNMSSPQQAQYQASNNFVNRTSGGSFTPIYTNENTPNNNINNIIMPTQCQSVNYSSNIQVQAVNNMIFNQLQESNITTDPSLFNLSQLDDLVPLQNSEELRISNLSIST
ncbi:hypothetical protein DOY81_005975 [Sarcophaga bullata]|nr:hypothetical protein DOY81_005975 [Sarcophaga bullata]